MTEPFPETPPKSTLDGTFETAKRAREIAYSIRRSGVDATIHGTTVTVKLSDLVARADGQQLYDAILIMGLS